MFPMTNGPSVGMITNGVIFDVTGSGTATVDTSGVGMVGGAGVTEGNTVGMTGSGTATSVTPGLGMLDGLPLICCSFFRFSAICIRTDTWHGFMEFKEFMDRRNLIVPQALFWRFLAVSDVSLLWSPLLISWNMLRSSLLFGVSVLLAEQVELLHTVDVWTVWTVVLCVVLDAVVISLDVVIDDVVMSLDVVIDDVVVLLDVAVVDKLL